MLRRCGFESALNISAKRPVSVFLYFDIFRTIVDSPVHCQAFSIKITKTEIRVDLSTADHVMSSAT